MLRPVGSSLVANQITTRHRRNELRIQRIDQSRQLKLLDQMTKRLNQAIGKRLDIVSCNTMRREQPIQCTAISRSRTLSNRFWSISSAPPACAIAATVSARSADVMGEPITCIPNGISEVSISSSCSRRCHPSSRLLCARAHCSLTAHRSRRERRWHLTIGATAPHWSQDLSSAIDRHRAQLGKLLVQICASHRRREIAY